MGFEIHLHYYNKKQDSTGYDTEHPEVMIKSVGKKTEDVSLEDVAGLIMKYYLRRDIMCFDVDVFEFAKRKISFKETTGGIVLKNKKFLFTPGGFKVTEESEEIPEEEFKQSTLPQVKKVIESVPPARFEVFTPDKSYLPVLRSKNIKLTPNKKYGILEEKTVKQTINGPYGIQETMAAVYSVIDDDGKRVQVHSCHFVPETKGLLYQNGINPIEEERPKLTYMDQMGDNMPT